MTAGRPTWAYSPMRSAASFALSIGSAAAAPSLPLDDTQRPRVKRPCSPTPRTFAAPQVPLARLALTAQLALRGRLVPLGRLVPPAQRGRAARLALMARLERQVPQVRTARLERPARWEPQVPQVPAGADGQDATLPATATLADAQSDDSTTVLSWTPQRVAQSVAAHAPSGGGTAGAQPDPIYQTLAAQVSLPIAAADTYGAWTEVWRYTNTDTARKHYIIGADLNPQADWTASGGGDRASANFRLVVRNSANADVRTLVANDFTYARNGPPPYETTTAHGQISIVQPVQLNQNEYVILEGQGGGQLGVGHNCRCRHHPQ